ncbi:MAG: hypothetical protein MJE68_18460 [Proteobacteria bacterium]|nr:hypothetical protein [Pseudomonadota bacterium]
MEGISIVSWKTVMMKGKSQMEDEDGAGLINLEDLAQSDHAWPMESSPYFTLTESDW